MAGVGTFLIVNADGIVENVVIAPFGYATQQGWAQAPPDTQVGVGWSTPDNGATWQPPR